MKTHLLAYLITTLISALSIVLGLLAAEDTAIRMGLVVGAPVVLFLVADRIAFVIETKHEFRSLEHAIRASQAIASLSDTDHAMQYILANVSRARHILNTRVAPRVFALPALRNAQAKLDRLLLQALRNKVHYDLIVSQCFADDASNLAEQVNSMVAPGLFRYAILEEPQVSTFQMGFIILDYGESAEMILWLPLSTDLDLSRRVLLVRDELLVGAFKDYHGRILDSAPAIAQAPPVRARS